MEACFENTISINVNLVGNQPFLFCWTGQVSTNHEGQCLEMVGKNKLKLHVGGVKTICVNDRYNTGNQHGGFFYNICEVLERF